MIFFRTPRFSRKIYSNAVFSFPRKPGSLFFTFDDGPDPFVTPRVLELLRKHNAKATFFCLGSNVEKYPELYHDILKEGHTTGNHSYSHLNGLKTSTTDYLSDIQRAGKFIESNLLRPPYGVMRPGQYQILREKYKLILWDIMVYDFNKIVSIHKTIEKVKKLVSGGEIIVFHDAEHACPKVLILLEKLLDYFSEARFSFDAISPALFRLPNE